MKRIKIVDLICLTTAISLTLSLFPAELCAEPLVQEEIVTEESGFDENAHGEVIRTGNCGLFEGKETNENAKYNLYKDGTLYIFGSGAIKGCPDGSGIYEIYIEEGITEIGNNTFQFYKNLEKVTLPNSLKKIDGYAFELCEKLSKIILPNSVEHIGEGAFTNCSSLEIINIPENIEEINDQIFGECINLKEIKIPLSVTRIGNLAFCGCGIEKIEIPNNVESIGVGAFNRCKLKSIQIPEGIKEIKDSTFWNCVNLESVYLPSSIKIIGKEAFGGCENLKNINIPEGTEEIKEGAFTLCNGIRDLEIPDSIIFIGKDAFSCCFDIRFFCKSNSIAEWYAIGNFINYELLEGESKNPAFPNSFEENKHGNILYEGDCEEENSYNPRVHYKLYEDGMVYIYGNGTIGKIDYKHINLGVYLYIEDGITGIGKDVFYASRIGWIRFPNTLKTIGENSFRDCKVKKLTFPDGLESIGEFAFSSCGLEKIYIPASVQSIKSSSFAYCSNIKNIEVSENNNVYDSRNNCNAIIETNRNNLVRGCMNTVIPKSIIYVGEYSFSDCVGLKNITIPDGVEEIGQRAFIGCENLESVKFPSSLKSTGDYAFYGCDKLHKHNYESTITKESTCKETGIRTYTCNCGDEYTEEIPATGHDIVIDHAVEPTSTETGKTEGSHCSVCGEILKAQEILPATGKTEKPTELGIQVKNTFSGCKESPVKLSISCKENDEFTLECKDNCGMEGKYTGYSSIIAGGFISYSKNYELTFKTSGEHIISVYKNGQLIENDKIIISENHTWDSGKIESMPTCTKNGNKKFTCSNCNNSYTEEIAATGHNYSTWKTTKKATIFKTGTQTRKCSNCGEKEVQTIQKLKSSVSIKKKISLKRGKTKQLKITKKSKGDSVASWKSSKKSVATVNSKGKVTAKKKGKAKITVKMKSGCKATCTVTVK